MLFLALIAVGPLMSAAGPLTGTSTSIIKSKAYGEQCLGTEQSGSIGDGATVTLAACKSGRYGASQGWEVPPAGQAGPIKANGYCLDAGIDPHNGGSVHMWTCYEEDKLPQQQWTIKADGTVETANGQCLNVKKESDGKELQTWACNSEDPQNLFQIDQSF